MVPLWLRRLSSGTDRAAPEMIATARGRRRRVLPVRSYNGDQSQAGPNPLPQARKPPMPGDGCIAQRQPPAKHRRDRIHGDTYLGCSQGHSPHLHNARGSAPGDAAPSPNRGLWAQLVDGNYSPIWRWHRAGECRTGCLRCPGSSLARPCRSVRSWALPPVRRGPGWPFRSHRNRSPRWYRRKHWE